MRAPSVKWIAVDCLDVSVLQELSVAAARCVGVSVAGSAGVNEAGSATTSPAVVTRIRKRMNTMLWPLGVTLVGLVVGVFADERLRVLPLLVLLCWGVVIWCDRVLATWCLVLVGEWE